MDNFSITQNGKPLDKSLYTIDLDNKVFFSKENSLVLDFRDCYGWTFKTGGKCLFTTGGNCTFKTYDNCTFHTGGGCTFDTDSKCIFVTRSYCTFKTGYNCTFKTGSRCTFKTYDNCTFKTGGNCTFTTGYDCTFQTGELCTFSLYGINTCKFKSYNENSIILDRQDKKHYLLTKEFIALQKVKNG